MRQLIFLALMLALGYLVTRLFPKRRIPRAPDARGPSTVVQELVQDPYCLTYLPRSQAIRRKIRGSEYCFCSSECLDKFLASRS